MRSVTWYIHIHIHLPPQLKTQLPNWTVSCQICPRMSQWQLHCHLPPCTQRLWQRLCDHPCSWPGGSQLLQLQLEVCPPPPPLTAAAKCPRKDHHMSEELGRKPKRPKALSALREIRKLQEGVEPILPWLSIVRLVHELLFDRRPYRVQCQAIKALQVAAQEYIIEVLGGGNLACMHRDQCTLAPKDIRLFRRLRGDVDSIGEAPETEEARREDWRRYKKDCLTPGEAMVMDTNRCHKLRMLIQKRRQRFQQNLRR